MMAVVIHYPIILTVLIVSNLMSNNCMIHLSGLVAMIDYHNIPLVI